MMQFRGFWKRKVESFSGNSGMGMFVLIVGLTCLGVLWCLGQYFTSGAGWGGFLVERSAMGGHWAALAQEPARARRTDDRRVISGIVHVLKTGCRWQDCPAVYGPSTTVYNRFRRWTMRGIWRRLFDALARADPGDGQAIDSTRAKAHRSAAGGKGGRRRRRLAARAAGAPQKSTPSSMRAGAPSPSK